MLTGHLFYFLNQGGKRAVNGWVTHSAPVFKKTGDFESGSLLALNSLISPVNK